MGHIQLNALCIKEKNKYKREITYMAKEEKIINLEEMANGVLSAQVNIELQKVFNNIMDPNTDATKVRKVTVVMSFKPNSKREKLTTNIKVTSNVQPVTPLETEFYIGKNLKTGVVQAEEFRSVLKGQMSVEEAIDEAEKIQKDASISASKADAATEDQTEGNVVDLRRVGNK